MRNEKLETKMKYVFTTIFLTMYSLRISFIAYKVVTITTILI